MDTDHIHRSKSTEGVDSTLSWSSNITDPEHVRFAEIYAFHLSSFEPLFMTELTKYYHNNELTSLVVLATTSVFCPNGGPHKWPQNCLTQDTIEELIGIKDESRSFDFDTFHLISMDRDIVMMNHYPYLFTGSGVGLHGDKYAGTALRILEFLCAHPPHPLPCRSRPRKDKTSKISSRRGVSTQSALSSSSRTAPRKLWQRTHCRFLRKLRVEKHYRGVVLSLPQTERIVDPRYHVIPCQVGLRVLPEILHKSSNSPELVNFIRTHGKDIAFLPKLTRMAIRAMYEYLDRPDEDMDVE